MKLLCILDADFVHLANLPVNLHFLVQHKKSGQAIIYKARQNIVDINEFREYVLYNLESVQVSS